MKKEKIYICLLCSCMMLFLGCGNDTSRKSLVDGEGVPSINVDKEGSKKRNRRRKKNSPKEGESNNLKAKRKYTVEELKTVYTCLDSVDSVVEALKALMKVLAEHGDDEMLRLLAEKALINNISLLGFQFNKKKTKHKDDLGIGEMAYAELNKEFKELRRKYPVDAQQAKLKSLEGLIQLILEGKEEVPSSFTIIGSSLVIATWTTKSLLLTEEEKHVMISRYSAVLREEEVRSSFKSALERERLQNPILEDHVHKTEIKNHLKKIEEDPEKYRPVFEGLPKKSLSSMKSKKLTNDDFTWLTKDFK